MNITLTRIKNLQQKKKVNIKDLCSAIGISRTAYAAWYDTDRLPSTSYIIKLAKLFGVSSDYLLGLADAITGSMSTEKKMLIDTVKDFDAVEMLDIINYAGYIKIKREKQGKELLY